MHKRISSASIVLTVVAMLGGCSTGSIDSPQGGNGSVTPTDNDPFAPASAETGSEATNEDPSAPEPTPEQREPEDGDDPAESADAGSPEPGADSGTTPPTDSGTPPTDSGTTAPAPAADSGSPAPTPAVDSGTAPPPVKPAAGTCDDPSSLKQLVTCVTDRMPRSDSNRYTMPSDAVQTAWRGVIRQMLNGACEGIAIPTELAGAKVARLNENGRSYCVLREVADQNGDGFVDRGLGTFVVDPAAERELLHSAPHPFTDETTEQQAVAIFRDTHSRAFLYTGVHRRASGKMSTCQSEYHESDAAHEDTHLFHAATAEVAAFYGAREFTQIQWHGMATTTCPGVNVYMTYGVSGAPAPGTRLLALRDAMRAAHPDWTVHTPGSASCVMGGTSNVQGRMLNTVPLTNICGTSTKTSTGRFIHIEQQQGHRNPSDWIAAVNSAFPAQK